MRQIYIYPLSIAVLCIICLSSRVQADEKILIAAASNLHPVMDEIRHAFEKEHPSIKVGISYGSSGNFFAQIKHGAPYDIFFSADNFYPLRLEEEGLAVKGQNRVYGIGRIVLWVPEKSVLNVQKGLSIASDPAVKKFAIANPKHAPYGRAAEEALRYYGFWDTIQGKLVFGENISQTAQFIQTGTADAGIVALPLAVSPPLVNKGRYWMIPVESYHKLEQAYAILHRGKEKHGVKIFLEFMQGKNGKELLSRYGFILP
ncbi:MAG: molybdate ABC transporter substrate-binding protein [wastewater metagenome]|nr:molybdate ABC transporter substrate-binding protein [Candidatus Loosdrechtia aerotolerans]